MTKQTISVGYETYGKHWGNKIWFVRDIGRKNEGKKDYYCVMGLSRSGWWHLFYGTLAECRKYIRYEMGEIEPQELEKMLSEKYGA